MMNSIEKIYYKLWIDAIRAAVKTNKDDNIIWKYMLLIAFSVAQGFNLLVIHFILKIYFNFDVDIFIDFNLFPGTMLDGFLAAFISLFLPFILLNYILVFYKEKYKTLMSEFNGFGMKEGLAFMLYFFASMLLFILPVIIGKALS